MSLSYNHHSDYMKFHIRRDTDERKQFDVFLSNVTNNEFIVKMRIDDKKENRLSQDFHVAYILQKHDIGGFIRYIALYDKETNQFITEMPVYIPCSNNHIVAMPHIPDGSISDYDWTRESMHMLKSMIIHTILSLAVAFHKLGFVHDNLHWRNVLVEPTTSDEIVYKIGETTLSAKTNGIVPLITDFENAYWHKENIIMFWISLHRFVVRQRLRNIPGLWVYWNNSEIHQFIIELCEANSSIDNIETLVVMIERSTFDIHDI